MLWMWLLPPCESDGEQMDGKAGVVGGQNEFARRACKAIVRIMAELAGNAEGVARKFEEASRLLAERSGVSVEEAAGAILNALQRNECGAKETIEAINNLVEELQVRVKRKENLTRREDSIKELNKRKTNEQLAEENRKLREQVADLQTQVEEQADALIELAALLG